MSYRSIFQSSRMRSSSFSYFLYGLRSLRVSGHLLFKNFIGVLTSKYSWTSLLRIATI
jgi:hypothetical protein